MPRTSSRLAALPRGQAGIQTFARAIKPGVTTRQSVADLKKQQQQLVPPPSSTAITTSSSPSSPSCLPVSPSKKRKLHELQNVSCGAGQAETKDGGKLDPADAANVPEAATPSRTLRLGELALSTPRSGHYARPSAQEGEDDIPTSPSKRAATHKRNPVSLPRKASVAVVEAQIVERPACVDDLVALHSAFLKAVSIHMMHNGVNRPADLRELLPSIQRIWKKRKVVVKDLQRLIWVMEQDQSSSSSFRIANYGLGRVCLEKLAGAAANSVTISSSSRSEDGNGDLQERFEQTVDLLWEKALDAADGDAEKVDFLGTLGVSSIHESLVPFTTFRKGQQRLQDLKGGVIKLKTEKLRADGQEDPVPANNKSLDAASTRKKGLLDRIKDKQLRQAKLPPPPTKDMLLQRAAAERIEEVAGVLALLRPRGYTGNGARAVMTAQRTPFRMETIVQNVKDSLRNPVADREIEICLEILAREDVAGQWVNLVTVNQLRSVVLKSCADVQPKEIAARVLQLKIGWE
ncbi:DNA replication factor Cdt1 C-terminal domain-containing protein [Aspergillus homomorphus CBS 101889]|uniref:DNA replication factor Cdt1 C-terminal domain-containing protein n=1 Tax=Aspergillus homomorphus (strain CBS 101889) TaxID=1450537 RepID=A0A395HSH0_ASPHC|nr:hypothetical protein BO97DRAFT_406664 [Aspergillus homomorphus CBS 101889]RAL10892.1 hypothetical protein BO97DRAFT_406664 [Aspergillus homomorphus CBS 101889]